MLPAQPGTGTRPTGDLRGPVSPLSRNQGTHQATQGRGAVAGTLPRTSYDPGSAWRPADGAGRACRRDDHLSACPESQSDGPPAAWPAQHGPSLPCPQPCGIFFFQAEDGIRDDLVTGVQTCALPI